MYSKLIKRNLGFLVEKKITAERKGRRRLSFFSDTKRKEILVWMWLHGNKDKDQIKEIIKTQFNLLDDDAERLFYEAYPDGLDKQEEEVLKELDNVLMYVVDLSPAVVPDTINVLTNQAPETVLEQYNLNPAVQNQMKLVINTLLKRRNLT